MRSNSVLSIAIAGALSLTSALYAGPDQGTDTQILLIPGALPTLTNEILPSQLLYTENDISVVSVPELTMNRFSELVHKQLHGCGGFINVTAEVKAGKSPVKLVWEEQMRREAPRHTETFEIRGSEEVAELVSKADEKALSDFNAELAAFPDRAARSENGAKAAAFLKERAEKLGGKIAGFNTWTVANQGLYKKQPSVIASLPGSDSQLPHVVIGGHMDTFSPNMPGADDDASGSAVVMESLRAITTSGAKFKHTIDFIWYSAEEMGLVGSNAVVNEYTSRKIPVKAAIQFDMVGYKSDKDTSDIYFISDNTDADLTAAMKQAVDLYVPSKVSETACGYACSDHANWHRAGIPAVFPFEASFENYNTTIHTPQDAVSLLNSTHAFKFAKIALAYLGEIAVLEKLGN